MNAPRPHKYRMTISRTTIDKLGIKLYDKVSAVLAELIANSYDADAETASVTLPIGTYLARRSSGNIVDSGFQITVKDDGYGMTDQEINEFYLKVGVDRRKRAQHGGTSKEKARPVMGRKGIGKLAPFGICREVEVISAAGPEGQKSYPVCHLILRYDKIISETDEVYYPDVGDQDGTIAPTRGTTVILRHFDRRKVPDKATLQRQLTARFGLARADWNVTVKDSTGQAGQFDFGAGELDVDILESTRIDLDDRPVTLEVPEDDSAPNGAITVKKLPVKGWVAYAKQPYKDEVMAGVRIYTRGKIVSQTRDFGIPTGFTGEFKLRTYLTGYIEADWLDAEEDLIRSDRQDIVWNSEVGEAFKAWGQALLKELAERAEKSVKVKTWEEFVVRSAIIDKAKAAFPNQRDIQERVLDVAKLAVRGADREALRDEDYVNRVVGFSLSVAPHQALLENLHEIAADPNRTLDSVVEIFHRVQLGEMYSLSQVAKEKVDSVNELQRLICTATTERPLQKLIERAPWLISPDWTPLVMDKPLERFRKNFEAWYQEKFGEEISTTAIGCATKEPDFIFVNLPQSLEIVEVKKPRHSITDVEFQGAHRYLEAVRKFLTANPEIAEKFGKVQLTLVCESVDGLSGIHRSLIAKDVAIFHRPWQTILDSALTRYGDYLSAFEESRRIEAAGGDQGGTAGKDQS